MRSRTFKLINLFLFYQSVRIVQSAIKAIFNALAICSRHSNSMCLRSMKNIPNHLIIFVCRCSAFFFHSISLHSFVCGLGTFFLLSSLFFFFFFFSSLLFFPLNICMATESRKKMQKRHFKCGTNMLVSCLLQ